MMEQDTYNLTIKKKKKNIYIYIYIMSQELVRRNEIG